MPKQLKIFDMTRYIDKVPTNQFELMEVFRHKTTNFVFQLEKCPTTGTLHYQIRIKTNTKITLAGLIVLFHNQHMSHISPTSLSGCRTFDYVMKEDTRVEGPWTDKDMPLEREPLPWHVQEAWDQGLYPWQKTIYDSSEKREKRLVNVVIDLAGCAGKSTLTTIMIAHGKCQAIPMANDEEKIINSVMNRPISTCYLIDVARTSDKKLQKPLFMAIEQIKNGVVYDHRFKFQQRIFGSPMVWVFMNEVPQLLHLTQDKWVLWGINSKRELVPWEFPKVQSTLKFSAVSLPISGGGERPVTIERSDTLATVTL